MFIHLESVSVTSALRGGISGGQLQFAINSDVREGLGLFEFPHELLMQCDLRSTVESYVATPDLFSNKVRSGMRNSSSV